MSASGPDGRGVGRLVALPVDGRPVVRAQVVELFAAAGWDLVVPPVAALGHFRTPADRDALAAWLTEAAADAEGLVLSLDMLVYGGLVPSRFIADSEYSLIARLALLRDLKARHPALPIHAFAATMRLSNNDVAEEEKPYWSDYGRLIWRWSYHTDRHAVLGDAADEREATAARARIPDAIAEDYLATRARNLAVTRAALDMVEAGLIDRLILPQDDTAEFGWNIAERRLLAAEVTRRGLVDRVAIHPGADEVLATLAAHLVGSLKPSTARKVFLCFGEPDQVAALTARYEDRPFLDTVRGQLAACGLVECATPDAADVIVAVHTRGTAQGDWAMRAPLPQPTPINPLWARQLREWVAAARPVALLDAAYANGGDPALIDTLGDLPLARLAGYGAWNTAGNRAGMLFATLALNPESDDARARLLSRRLYEDFLWQAVERQRVRDRIREDSLSPSALTDAVRAHMVPAADTWGRAHALPWRVADISLPWGRTFEIDLALERAA
ncbi:MAG: DUF4127 family protein [Betaproteobacteria bacterium]|nr:DUF4127 family protein [Betaproteobacteria bacterium]